MLGEVDVITSTLGKALGGAAGGFVAGPAALCDYLTQRSRPQLFSNALPPTVAASALAAVEFIEQHPERVRDAARERALLPRADHRGGFKPLPGETPIVPIIVGETAAAIQMSEMLLDEGVFVTGFGFPVVPQGEARVRCQISAAHTRDDLDEAVAAFKKVGRKLEADLMSGRARCARAGARVRRRVSTRRTGDHEALPALGAGLADAAHACAVAGAVHHARREPAIDVRRQMAHHVAAGGMHPHAGLFDARRIGDEDQLIALAGGEARRGRARRRPSRRRESRSSACRGGWTTWRLLRAGVGAVPLP